MFTPTKEPQSLAQFSDLSQFSEPKFLVCRGSPGGGTLQHHGKYMLLQVPWSFSKESYSHLLGECMLWKGKYLGILRAIGYKI